ncbi:uncharacterized protein LOC142231817 [Haematobia irritans]|uniref:uncharacterized protein LOC142231817 n=1 Tax=Haematobia irritans TaxID=7368 RepID=UPI003F500BB0
MYKTIRHGENSLQYTILPQNDDFRLEGKIKSSGSSKKCKNKRPRRRSFFAYLGLLFVCTVIIGAVLVPFLVSAECLPNPAEWFLKTKAAFTKSPSTSTIGAEHPHSGHSISTHAGNALANSMLNKGNVLTLNKANVGKPVKIINKDGVEKIILKVNKTSISSNTATDEKISNQPVINSGNSAKVPAETEVVEKITIHDLNEVKNIITTMATEIEPEKVTQKQIPATSVMEAVVAVSTSATLTIPLLNRTLSSAALPNVPRASLQSPLNPNSNNSSLAGSSSSTQPTITTRIMQVPLLKSTAKKPAMPPVLVKNLSPPIQPTSETNSNLNDIIPSNTANIGAGGNKAAVGPNGKEPATNNNDWIHTHWPYIDPSTYFQWNGYKTEDSVLLPALLGFALIGVILIITVCLVARNKRTIVSSVRKRNRNDIETGAEDNTTLLTNTNLSDED